MSTDRPDDGDDLGDLGDVVVPDDLSSLFGDEAGTSGAPTDAEGEAGEAPDGDAPIADEVAPTGAGAGEESEKEAEPKVIRTTAVVLTAVRQAKMLAGLLALTGIEAAVVPSARGALAVRYVEQLESEADPAELLDGVPRDAEALGAALSVATRSEVVLLAAQVDEVGGEVTGQVRARRYRGGQKAGEPPPGLVLAQADPVAERLLIGLVQAPEVTGYISSADLGKQQRGRGLFRRRREEDA